MLTTLLIALKIIPTIFMALFPAVNPIGTALILSGMTKDVHPDVWKKTSLKIAMYAFLILSFFFLAGVLFLKLFGITIPVVQVSGGLVLAFMGWQLLNSNDSKNPSPGGGGHDTDESTEEKTFYPFTFPLTVGPGCLAIVITFSAHLGHDTLFSFTEHVAGLAGIVVMCVTVYLCYSNLKYISGRFSPVAAMAISKMLAFFVICIGVQIFWTGLHALMP
jgi:multiple antibiotic resistance protein